MLKDAQPPSGRKARGRPVLPMWTPALLAAILLLTVALVGCGGDSTKSVGEATRRPAESTAETAPTGEQGAKRESPAAMTQPGRSDGDGESEVEVTSLSAKWGDHACGVRSDSTVVCWGNNSDDQSRPPGGEFTSVNTGSDHTCGVRRDGSVVCWGDDGWGQSKQPDGQFASVSAGAFYTCGVMLDGSVQCWGGDFIFQPTLPDGEFAAVSSGSYFPAG